VRDRYKVLIIDEAHMLSKAAFNALLKTLEEPPPNVVFVLATTEMQKVLPTILSRCQVFEFRRVGVRETADYLRRIGEAEKIIVSDAGWERIARAGEGSVRDSLSILERVLAFCGQEVDDDDLLRMLGGVRLEVLTGLFEGLVRRDAAAMLAVLDGLVDEGHDLLHFWSELIAALRDLMLMRAAPGREEMLARSAAEAEALGQAAAGLSVEDLTRVFQILADLETGLKASTHPRFLFEAALIRLAGLGAVRPIEEVLQSLAAGAVEGPSPPPAPQKKNPVERHRSDRPARSRPASSGSGGFAERLIESVKDGNPMLGVVLEEASAISLAENEVQVRFAAGQELMARQLARRENLDALKRHAEQVAGRKLGLRVDEPSAGSGPTADGALSPEPRSASPEKTTRRRDGRRQKNTLLDQAKKEPGVKKLFHEFGAQVVDVRPLEAPQDRNRAVDDTEALEDAT
jgi:DNA polymerase-3 subunit gamma/tau